MSAIRGAFDVRRLRAGQAYEIDQMVDGRVRQFVYEIDGDSRLAGDARGARWSAAFLATIARIPKDVTVTTVEGDINRQTNSLTAAIDKAGEGIDLALGDGECLLGRDRLQLRPAARRSLPRRGRARDARGRARRVTARFWRPSS